MLTVAASSILWSGPSTNLPLLILARAHRWLSAARPFSSHASPPPTCLSPSFATILPPNFPGLLAFSIHRSPNPSLPSAPGRFRSASAAPALALNPGRCAALLRPIMYDSLEITVVSRLFFFFLPWSFPIGLLRFFYLFSGLISPSKLHAVAACLVNFTCIIKFQCEVIMHPRVLLVPLRENLPLCFIFSANFAAMWSNSSEKFPNHV